VFALKSFAALVLLFFLIPHLCSAMHPEGQQSFSDADVQDSRPPDVLEMIGTGNLSASHSDSSARRTTQEQRIRFEYLPFKAHGESLGDSTDGRITAPSPETITPPQITSLKHPTLPPLSPVSVSMKPKHFLIGGAIILGSSILVGIALVLLKKYNYAKKDNGEEADSCASTSKN
jgi:hypothetical protein